MNIKIFFKIYMNYKEPINSFKIEKMYLIRLFTAQLFFLPILK